MGRILLDREDPGSLTEEVISGLELEGKSSQDREERVSIPGRATGQKPGREMGRLHCPGILLNPDW